MIISKNLRYVYIGIPRTGSKSMNRWLMNHYQGEWFGDHHDWQVPEFAKDYLIFTTVRNPYQRAVSGYFGLLWGDDEIREELRERVPVPDKSTNPLVKIIQEAIARGDDMNQLPFVEQAGVALALYFERLPAALRELPFVDKTNVPTFPHVLERGIRPPGDFFDFFGTDDEAVFWQYSIRDFNAFGYQRFSCDLPAESPNMLHLRKGVQP